MWYILWYYLHCVYGFEVIITVVDLVAVVMLVWGFTCVFLVCYWLSWDGIGALTVMFSVFWCCDVVDVVLALWF